MKFVQSEVKVSVNLILSSPVDTTFIETERETLLAPYEDKSRVLKTLRYLSEVMVNGTDIPGLQGKPGVMPAPLPQVDEEYQRGFKQVCLTTRQFNHRSLDNKLLVMI